MTTGIDAVMCDLASFAVGLKHEDLPEEVVKTARVLLLDHVGTVFAGMQVRYPYTGLLA